MNLVDHLTTSSAMYPESVAVFSSTFRITYKEFMDMVTHMIGWIQSQNVQPEDRIVVFMPNGLEFVLSYLGIVGAGAVVVPLNWMLREPELEQILLDCKPVMLFTLSRFAPVLQKAIKNLDLKLPIWCADQPGSVGTQLPEFLSQAPAADPMQCSPAHPAAIIYTNAEDGYPKGAVLSHRNIALNAEITVSHWNTNRDDIVAAVLPFFHTYGVTTSIFSPIAKGLSIFLIPHFNPKDVCELIQQYKPTIFTGVPTMYAGLLGAEGVQNYDLSSVRNWISGGMALPSIIQKKFETLIGKEMREGYGLTEASPCVTWNWLEYPRKIGSIGMMLRSLQGIIAGHDDTELPRGETGELLVKGETVMLGYYNQPELTAQTIVNGWLHTGDIGHMDAEGYIYLTGRKRNMYLTGGFNIYPKEIERLLLLHPDIEQAEVTAKPDLAYGELGHAKVTLKSGKNMTEQELASFCRRVMALYKIPRTFEIVLK